MSSPYQRLQRAIDWCTACKSHKLKKNQANELLEAGRAVVSTWASEPNPTEAVHTGGTVPCAVLRLLRHFLGITDQPPTSAGGAPQASAPQLLKPVAAAAVQALVTLLSAYIFMLGHTDGSDTADSLAVTFGGAQPCAVLAALLRLSAVTPPPSQLHHKDDVELVLPTMSVASALLHLAAQSPPFLASIRTQLHTSSLVTLTCDTVLAELCDIDAPQLPLVLRSVELLFSAFLVDPNEPAFGSSRVAVPAGPAGAGPRTLRAALAAEPAFTRLLLRATPLYGAEPANLCGFVHALRSWLFDETCSGGTLEIREALQPTAQLLIDIVDAVRRSGETDASYNLVVGRVFLYVRPTGGEKQRAYPAVLDCAQRAVDACLRLLREASPVSDGVSYYCITSSFLLRSLLQGGESYVGQDETPLVVEGRRVRARAVVQRGLLAKCELFVRSHLWEATYLDLQEVPGEYELRAQLDCAALLLGDAADGAAALSACLAHQVTQRKVMVRLLADEALAVAAGQRLPPAAAPGGDGRFSLQATCQNALNFFLNHDLLPARFLGGCSAARVLLTCATLQLLPLLVSLAGRTQQVGGLGAAAEAAAFEEDVMLAKTLTILHSRGLANFTLAAGAPRVLLHLLQTPRHIGYVNDAYLATCAVAAALGTAAGCSAWVSEASRLRLLEELQAAVAWVRNQRVGQGLLDACGCMLAAVHLPHTTSRSVPRQQEGVHARLVSILDHLSQLDEPQESHAGSEGGSSGEAVTLDGCMLAAMALPTSSPGCVPPFFGCWNVRCTNLEGDTEATLKLRRCSGCKHARYCSDACQRQAWPSGHRVACTAWQKDPLAIGLLLLPPTIA